VLLGTKTATLEEDSKTDYIWGVGRNGSGQNLLGKILMRVRTELEKKDQV